MTIPKKTAADILSSAKEKDPATVGKMVKVKKIALAILVGALILTVFGYGIYTVIAAGNNMAGLRADLSTTKTELLICQKNLSNFNNVKERDVVAIVSYIRTYYKRTSTIVAKEIAKHATELSQKRGLALPLIIGIMEVESAFNPVLVSKAIARGLMQVRYSVWKTKLSEVLQIKSAFDLHEIDKGIEAGIMVFNIYLEQSNNNISEALYLYVGKDRTYATQVYEKMGRFVLYKASMSMPAAAEVILKPDAEETKSEVKTDG